MKIIAKCSNNYEVSKAASQFVFGEYDFAAAHVFRVMLPSALMTGAYFVIKWHGHKFKVGYHVNGTIYLYVYNN